MPKATVKEIARRFRVSKFTVYNWIDENIIPGECIERIGRTIRIDEMIFESLLKAGKLSRLRKVPTMAEMMKVAMAEDSHTTTGSNATCQHKWQAEDGSVLLSHPFSKESILHER